MMLSSLLAVIAALLPCTVSATKHIESNFDHFINHLDRTIAQTNHALAQPPLSAENQLEALALKDEDGVVPRATKARTAVMPLTAQAVGNREPAPSPILWYFAFTGKSTTGVGSKLQKWTYSSLDTANSYYNVHGPGCPISQCGFFPSYNQGGTPLGTNTTVFFGTLAESGEDFSDRVCVRGAAGLCVSNTTVVGDDTGTAIIQGEANLGLSFGIVTPPSNNSKVNVPEKSSFLSSLMAQKVLAANEFSISYGGSPEFKLGGINSTLFQAPLSTFPVMPIGASNPGYWQLELQGLTGGAPNASSNTLIANTGGVAIMDSLSPSIVGPTAEIINALKAVTNRTGIKFESGTIKTGGGKQNATLFTGLCNNLSSWDLGLQFGNKAFAIPASNLNLGRNSDADIYIAGEANGLKKRGLEGTKRDTDLPGRCLLAIAGYDFDLPGDDSKPVYVVGFPFMREWYSVYNFENGGTVSFGKDIG